MTELIEIVGELAASRDLARLAGIVPAAARRLTGADAATFILSEGDACVYLDEDARVPLWKGQRLPLASCLAGWAMRHRTPVAIADIHADPHVPMGQYAPTFVRSLLIVPIGRDEPVGAIGTYWAAEHAATEAEVATLETLARAASLALANVRLWAEAQRSREALAELARERQRRVHEFETLVNVLPVGIGVALDPLGDVIHLNKAFSEMLAVPQEANASLSGPEDQRPRNFRVLCEGRDVPPEDLPLQKAAREGVEVRDVEVDVVFDTGRHLRLLEYAAPLFDEDGRTRGSVGVFIDVTDRFTVERALRASEERFRLLANQAPVMVWVADRAGRCTFLSDTWYDFTGQTRTSADHDWRAGVHPDDRSRVVQAFEQAGLDPQPYRVEYRLQHRAGGYRWTLEAATPYRQATGSAAGFIGSVFDITERKQFEERGERLLERERLTREEAERANRLKDDFLASLSHELRTPLNAILGWTSLLKRKGIAPEFLARGLETLERNAKLQAQLIDDLLDMSRILSGQVRLDAQPVSLAAVAHAAIEAVRPSADAKGIRLTSLVAPDASDVLGDPIRLQQVAWNLLTNAIKFTGRGGVVTATVGREGGAVTLTVTDTGIGIPPEFLPHVFERFRQADASTTRRHGGLGLGLAIVDHLVVLHGGTVQADSRGRDHGATFVVRLPALDRARPAAARPSRTEGHAPTADVSLAGVSVLVVDDDEDARALMALILEGSGANVRTVDSARAALDLAVRAVPDVLISDIGLPDVDGYQLIRQVRRLGGGFARVPAMALTAFARAEDRRRALEAGFDVHVAKPVTPDALRRAVAELLEIRGLHV